MKTPINSENTIYSFVYYFTQPEISLRGSKLDRTNVNVFCLQPARCNAELA